MSDDFNADRARYNFKKAMQEIIDLRGRGTELISLYVPPGRHIHEVQAYLRDEYSQSSNIKSKGTRKNVMSAIESIQSRLRTYKNVPENGLVLFCGEVAAAGDQTRMVQHVLEPPEPITAFQYRCDSTFFTEPLLDMAEDKKSYGLIVLDRAEASIGLLTGKRIIPLKNFDSLVPRKHRQGGQSAQRFERIIELAAHEFYKKIANLSTEAFLERTDLQGILVGGPGYTKEYFIREGYLHHELQKKVVDTFDTSYTDEYGLKELVEVAQSALVDMDITREKELIKRLLEEIRKIDGGLAAYGEDEVREMITMGAVDTLLLSEGLELKRLGLRCPNDHFNEVTQPSSREENPPCPDCGEPTEREAEEDIVDDLFELAANMASNVELISVDSEEGEMLMQAFGGIAALLRFRAR